MYSQSSQLVAWVGCGAGGVRGLSRWLKKEGGCRSLPYIISSQQCQRPAIHSNILCSSHEHQQKEECCNGCNICILYPAHSRSWHQYMAEAGIRTWQKLASVHGKSWHQHVADTTISTWPIWHQHLASTSATDRARKQQHSAFHTVHTTGHTTFVIVITQEQMTIEERSTDNPVLGCSKLARNSHLRPQTVMDSP